MAEEKNADKVLFKYYNSIDGVKEHHIIPMSDIIEHVDNDACICSPFWDPQNKEDFKNGLVHSIVIVHQHIGNMLQ